jgi:hypothetical protein
MTPKKSEVLGCSVLRKCGEAFDDYSVGYHGAIAAICFAKHNAKDTGSTTLSQISTNYAGHPVSHGGNESTIAEGQACFYLNPAETIVHVEAEVQVNKQGNDMARLYSLQFTTNTGRQSGWFGRASKQGVGKKSTILSLEAPVNNSHVIAIHGFGTEANTTSAVHGLGVYWGYGGGAGVWAPIKSCVGCGSWSFEFDYGTDKTHSTETQVTRTWTMTVTAEMGYSFGGFSAGLSISNTWSSQVMHDTKDSFEVTTMEKRSFTCDKDNLYQWQMTSSFDDPVTPVTTFTSYMACTDDFAPCCLPGTFSKDPSVCDLKPDAPNNCHKRNRLTYV